MIEKNVKALFDEHIQKTRRVDDIVDKFYVFDNQVETALSKINSQSKKGKELKQEAGWETVGQLLGNYFSVNPLPYRPIKDMKDVYEGVFGKETKSDRDKADTKAKKGDGEVNVKDAMIKGYRKFGVTDW